MRNPRALATQIIYSVCYDHISLSEVLSDSQFQPRDDDRGLMKEICFGTIRFWIRLQAILKILLEKPIKTQDKDIECLLCVGLYQIIYMHVPDYAVVNETVTVTRILKKSWASGLVNKILRMGIEMKSIEVKGITAHYAHPNWIIDQLKIDWPNNWDKILESNNAKAPLFLRINKTKITIEQFEKILKKNNIQYKRVDNLSHALLLPNALAVEKIPGFFEGWFSVQDASGQKVIEYCDFNNDQVVLDACAAPGSKTTHILESFPHIKKCVAIDISHNRLSKIKDNIKRLQLSIHKYIQIIE